MTSTVEMDVLVVSSSWELRSTSFAERIFPRFRFIYALIFRYTPENARAEAARLEERNYHLIKAYLDRAGVRVITVPTRLRSSEVALMQLNEELRNLFGRDTDLRILLDISTFTKAHTLVFLRYLADFSKHNTIKVLFTDIVSPNEGEPSRGLDGVISLPLFGGMYRQDTDLLLFLFLGFEPDRIIGLWKALEPNATVPLFARRRDGKSPLAVKAYSKELLNYPGVMDPVEIPTAPLRAAGSLAQLYATYSPRYNLAMSATGSKLQCVGIYLSLQLTETPLPLFYPVPTRYSLGYWNPYKYEAVSLLMTVSPLVDADIIGARGDATVCESSLLDRYV